MSLFFHKPLLLASGWIFYCYSWYRHSQRFLCKRFKYFYKDFHRTYCFLPFLLSPSLHYPTGLSVPLQSLQTLTRCPVTISQQWPSSSFSQLLHPCIPSSPPQHPGLLHASFPWFIVYICFSHNFPMALCWLPTILHWPCHPRKHTVVSKHTVMGQGVQARLPLTRDRSVKGGFGQSHTQSSKTWVAGKWCLRPQAPCLCYSSKFRHEILPCTLLLPLAASHKEWHEPGEGAAQVLMSIPGAAFPGWARVNTRQARVECTIMG